MGKTLKFGNGVWANKKGSTLAYNDENGNFKPLPFTTTRSTSATRVNKEGLIEVVSNDVPRVDYTDSEDGVFLLEKASTNLFPYSEDFSNADWTKNSGTTITNNYAISPDGTLNASRYLGTGASGLGDKFTLSATSYTLSFYVKSNTSENQFCRLIGDSSNISENLLITTEWTRLSYTFTGSGLSNKTNGIFRDSSDNDIDVLIYGAMLEQNSVASSYIPTQGAAVTRSAETASGSGNSEVFNDSEGVLIAEIKPISLDGTYKRITISDGTTINRIILGFDNINDVTATVYNGSNQAVLGGDYTGKDQLSKYALKYKENDFSLWINGFEVSVDASGITFPNGTLNQLKFEDGTGTNPFYGKTKQLAYYDTALTDIELETLTSYRSWESMVKELNLNIIHNE